MAKVLVVDDSSFIRKTLARILTEAEHEILEASNGQEALDTISLKSPDCVILDLLMPVMDGITTLRVLNECKSTVPVIVLSADIQESARNECFSLGVKNFLNKPPKKEELFSAIEKALS